MPSPKIEDFKPSQVSPVPCDFKVGDTVKFTNDYGIEFSGLKVIGYTDKLENGRFIHLNTSCWWFPVRPESLTLEERAK